jgi:hypothetical protein
MLHSGPNSCAWCCISANLSASRRRAGLATSPTSTTSHHMTGSMHHACCVGFDLLQHRLLQGAQCSSAVLCSAAGLQPQHAAGLLGVLPRWRLQYHKDHQGADMLPPCHAACYPCELYKAWQTIGQASSSS